MKFRELRDHQDDETVLDGPKFVKVLGQLSWHQLGRPEPDPAKGPVVGILIDVDAINVARPEAEAYKPEAAGFNDVLQRVVKAIVGQAWCEPTAVFQSIDDDLAEMVSERLGFRVCTAHDNALRIPHMIVEGLRTLEWPGIAELVVVSSNKRLAVLAEEARLHGKAFSVARFVEHPAPELEAVADRVILLGDWVLGTAPSEIDS